MSDASHWKSRLRKRFGKSVQLSANLRIDGTDDVVISMTKQAAARNMQEDASAFETWALAVRADGAKSVTLQVIGDPTPNPHFNRFKYRASRFGTLFGWFRLARPFELDPPIVAGSKVPLLLNVENAPRLDERGDKERQLVPSLDAEEHVLEMALAYSTPFWKSLMVDGPTGRQLPVGVFRDKVTNAGKKKNIVFSSQKSAIDLWGIAGDRLLVLELKNAKNKKLGALAELFFYSMLMRDLQKGILAFDSKNGAHQAIPSTKSVQAFVLAPSFHPLIEGDGASTVKLLNDGLSAKAEPVSFGLARLEGGLTTRIVMS